MCARKREREREREREDQVENAGERESKPGQGRFAENVLQKKNVETKFLEVRVFKFFPFSLFLQIFFKWKQFIYF